MPTDARARHSFLGVGFDAITLDALVQRMKLVSKDDPYAYVVTPNVDHLVRLQAGHDRDRDHAAVLAAYHDAWFCVCDSRILARLAKLLGVALPVVPGSDLTARLFAEVIAVGDVVMIVGGDHELMAALQRRFPDVAFRHHMPPMGLRHDEAALDAAADYVARSGARFTFLAVGSPQQELLARRIAFREGAGGCALCIGASIAFIVGREVRAPKEVQRLGLEWGWRLAQNPARLWRRYLVEGPKIFLYAWRWKRSATRR